MTTTAEQAAGTRPSAERARIRRIRHFVLIVLGCALLAAGWMQLGPVGLGGKASYVVTDGTSMLPKFHSNGLVITRQQDRYQVGDVAAYHNKQLHTVVMHRIVARDGDRFVFKGDNNDFRDRYHPTRSEIVGTEWAYWPDGGRYLMLVRQPVVFAIILGGLAFLAASGFARDAEDEEEAQEDETHG